MVNPVRLFCWALGLDFRKKMEKDKANRERYFIKDLSEALNQNYQRVHCAIKRLGIKPCSELGKRKRYSKSTLVKLSRHFKDAKPYRRREPKQQEQSGI